MSEKLSQSQICPFKVSETYHVIYELQEKLGISDEYLLNTVRGTQDDLDNRQSLKVLLDSSKTARNNLITWYLKQTLVELNVTISLLTAKMKFIEYKLGLCDGVDLHQACSLALVNFCNILSDLTVLHVEPKKRKTMQRISAEANVPIWLSHYRNQICHVPSESPCISILVPLVNKSLAYMQKAFWSKILAHETFDEQRFERLTKHISRLIHITSMNKRLRLKKDIEMGKKRRKLAEQNIVRDSKVCLTLRRILAKSPSRGVDFLAKIMIKHKPLDKTVNLSLLLEQIIFAKCFERFVSKIISHIESDGRNGSAVCWLSQLIDLISFKKKSILKENLRKMELSASVQIIKFIDVSSVKCCQLAYRLMKLDNPSVRKLIPRLRYRLMPLLGRRRTLLLLKLTRITGYGKGAEVVETDRSTEA